MIKEKLRRGRKGNERVYSEKGKEEDDSWGFQGVGDGAGGEDGREVGRKGVIREWVGFPRISFLQKE